MRKPIALTFLFIFVFSFFMALVLRENPMISGAESYAEQISTTAAGTYITLRSVNAVLSTAQDVEISVSLGGGGSAQPLKTLEPVDDTTERIAGLVFYIMVATGILSVSMGPISSVGFVMLGLASLMRFIEVSIGASLMSRGLALRFFAYGGFLALALPAAFVLSSLVAEPLTEKRLDENQKIVADIIPPVAVGLDDDGNFLQRARSTFERAGELATQAMAIWENADRLFKSYIIILAIFVFRIFVLPLMLLGAFFVLTRWFLEPERPG